MPKGVRKAERTMCQKGLHPMTRANTIYEGSVRRCFMCREASMEKRLRRHHKPRPTRTGMCMKGLHKWVEGNWAIDKDGVTRCRPCREAGHRAIYARTKVIPCVVKGCLRATHRADGNYVCRFHRQHPPPWFDKLGFTIVGTQLVQ